MAEEIGKPLHDKKMLVDLPQIVDKRGTLTVAEVKEHIPFEIRCVRWVHGMTNDEVVESKALRQQYEVLIVLSGSVDVLLGAGGKERGYTLDSPCKALYIPCMMDYVLRNFSLDAVCLLLSSETCSEKEKIPPYISLPQNAGNTVEDCLLATFSTESGRVNVVMIQNQQSIPFSIDRVFFIYNIPIRAERGMHAHKYCHEVLIAVRGSLEVELDDGVSKRTVKLNNPRQGLYIPPGVWATERKYSIDAVCLVLASGRYNEDDYINVYSEFIKYRENENRGL